MNTSKGLETLERIERDIEYVTRLDFVEPVVRGEVQQELYKIYHREEKDLDTIEKELKALEIIKEHIVYDQETNVLKANFQWHIRNKEEQDLLKEVLL